jgi:hypothetical protein
VRQQLNNAASLVAVVHWQLLLRQASFINAARHHLALHNVMIQHHSD